MEIPISLVLKDKMTLHSICSLVQKNNPNIIISVINDKEVKINKKRHRPRNLEFIKRRCNRNGSSRSFSDEILFREVNSRKTISLFGNIGEEILRELNCVTIIFSGQTYIHHPIEHIEIFSETMYI